MSLSTYEVRLEFTLQGRPCTDILHIEATSPDDADLRARYELNAYTPGAANIQTTQILKHD